MRKIFDRFFKSFENWELALNLNDFRRYKCLDCGKDVTTLREWVRGMALCRTCFEK